MAQEGKKSSAPAAQAAAPQSIGVRLVPSADSDLPILSNFARVHASPSGVLVDFGFFEPAGLEALSRAARSGGKMPEAINGRLAGCFADAGCVDGAASTIGPGDREHARSGKGQRRQEGRLSPS